MTVSGYPSQPSVLLADGAALAADTWVTLDNVVCVGRKRAYVRVVCDKSHDLYIRGVGAVGGTAADLYDGMTAMSVTAMAGSANGHGHVIDVRALGEIQVVLHNADVSNAATYTVEVTLSD